MFLDLEPYLLCRGLFYVLCPYVMESIISGSNISHVASFRNYASSHQISQSYSFVGKVDLNIATWFKINDSFVVVLGACMIWHCMSCFYLFHQSGLTRAYQSGRTSLGLPVWAYQSECTSLGLPVWAHQSGCTSLGLPVWAYQSECTSLGLPVWMYQSGLTSLGLPVWMYQSGLTSLNVPVWAYQSGLTSLDIPVWAYQSGLTSLNVPVWAYQSGLTSLGLPVWMYQSGLTSLGLPVWMYQSGLTSLGSPVWAYQGLPVWAQSRLTSLSLAIWAYQSRLTSLGLTIWAYQSGLTSLGLPVWAYQSGLASLSLAIRAYQSELSNLGLPVWANQSGLTVCALALYVVWACSLVILTICKFSFRKYLPWWKRQCVGHTMGRHSLRSHRWAALLRGGRIRWVGFYHNNYLYFEFYFVSCRHVLYMSTCGAAYRNMLWCIHIFVFCCKVWPLGCAIVLDSGRILMLRIVKVQISGVFD